MKNPENHPQPAPAMHRAFRLSLAVPTCLLLLGGNALAADPVVSNVNAAQRPGTKLVDITYDVTADTPTVSVGLRISSDSGSNFTVPVDTVTGAVGSGVTTGVGKAIVWDSGVDWNNRDNSSVQVEIVTAPSEFAQLIPDGNFTMGDSLDGIIDAAPVNVTLSSYWIGKYEVTKALWDQVRNWAVTHGYTDLAVGQGKAADHPVSSISWLDAVKWCNARSEKEGLPPVYMVDGSVFRTGDLITDVNWDSNGYRLPTEAEWEKAARGGLKGMRFAWGNTITHQDANYESSSFFSYDISQTRGPNPKSEIGGWPGTCSVASFPENGYGMYDVSGNVQEFCWDWFDVYQNNSIDPHGPFSGTSKVIRGGAWGIVASCTVAYRNSVLPQQSHESIGFRIARSLSFQRKDILVQLKNGIKAHYSFDGNGNDVSGNNNHIPVNHMNYVLGKSGLSNKAIYFEYGKAVEIPNSASWDDNNFTVSLWAKLEGDALDQWPQLTGKRADYSIGAARWGLGSYGYAANARSGMVFHGTSSFASREAVYYHPPVWDTWTHVCGTFDGAVLRLYVNGSLRGQTNVGSGRLVSGLTRPIFIGGNGFFDPAQTWNGPVSDYRYYNRTLSAVEVAAINSLESPPSRATSPVLSIYSRSWSLALTPNPNGTLSGSGSYSPGTSATLTATPNPGYRFIGWTGDASGTDNPLTLTMDADKTVGATFEKDLSDADGDGLSAYDELVVHQTDPTKADSDDDGLSDAFELGAGRFSVISGARTWAQAKAHAETQGGTLATFASATEWQLALTSIGPDALLDITGLWIGASDSATEGTWTWVTGEPFGFANWATGQPDNLNDSDFAAVAGDAGGTAGSWYDYRGTTTRDGYLLESGYTTGPGDADSDDDGLNDGAEKTAGSNPLKADTDSDGLSDLQEVTLTRTDPTRADSDGDSIADALDDQDGDGLGNLAELTTHRSDPLKADSDDDGLSDGVEVNTPGSLFQVVTGSFTRDQAVADAAARGGRLAVLPQLTAFTKVAARARRVNPGHLWLGLSDADQEGQWRWSDGTALAWERWQSGQPGGGTAENHAVLSENTTSLADAAGDYVAAGYLFERSGLNPLAADSDGDGLADGAEVQTHQTDPFDEDMDGDGLADGAELVTHRTNPKRADSDDDGLGDRVEVEVHRTNPNLADSDGDGFDDAFELSISFDPTLATSTPDARSRIRTAVEFEFDAARGVSYRVEASSNLVDWETIEPEVTGNGGPVSRLYSTKDRSIRYFRAKRN